MGYFVAYPRTGEEMPHELYANEMFATVSDAQKYVDELFKDNPAAKKGVKIVKVAAEYIPDVIFVTWNTLKERVRSSADLA